MQLKQKLHNVQRNKLSINEYSMKVKGLANSLGSIGAPIDDEDLVFVTLNGLGREYAQFWTSMRPFGCVNIFSFYLQCKHCHSMFPLSACLKIHSSLMFMFWNFLCHLFNSRFLNGMDIQNLHHSCINNCNWPK